MSTPSSPNFNWYTTSDDIVKYYKDKVNVSDKVVFITGATEGIGKNTVASIADFNPKQIVIAARNQEKASEMVAHLKEKHNYERVVVVDLDLASLDSVRSVPQQLAKNGITEISYVILNAGVSHLQAYTTTKDGFEWHFGINHLAHFLLWQLLEPLVVAAAKKDEARLVVLSSVAQFNFRSVNWEDFPPKKENYGWPALSGGMYAYSVSKLFNTLFANEVNRRMKEKGINITANSVHPGNLIATGIFSKSNPYLEWFVKHIVSWVTKTTAQGASTTIYCAFSTDLKGKGGLYFDTLVAVPPSTLVTEENQKKLWDLTEKVLNEQTKK